MSSKTYNKKMVNDKSNFNVESLIDGEIGVLKVDEKQYKIQAKGIPECTKACPAGVNVKAYVNLIANRRFEEAVEVIRQANPFPAVCGRVCTRPCEENCELVEKGDSVPIRALKRYASDYEIARRPVFAKPCKTIYNEKIAIIGAGPAGLTTAVDLINMGYPVTVFEEKKDPGGMLRYGIPPYRLPDRVLKREIDWIKSLGVIIKTGFKITDPSNLFKQGFSAVLIAGGAPKTFPLGIEGDKADGVIDALEFLKDINTGNKTKIEGNIVVIGAGSTAFDAARSSIRLGANKVILAYRRGIEEMPAEREEIDAAIKENVEILTLSIPKRIIVTNRKVTGIEFYKAKLGNPDESGRRRPIPIKDNKFTVKADFIIPAIGAMPDVGSVGGVKVTTPKGVIDVSRNGKTVVDGVFAAGDVEMGPSSVVDAIGRGHLAAKGIHEHLQKIDSTKTEEMLKTIQISLGLPICSSSSHTSKKYLKDVDLSSFEEVEGTFNDFEAVEEASRCFSCGPCYACPVCLPNCKNKQLVGEIEDKTALIKSPLELSKTIYEKGPTSFKIILKNKTKSMKLFSLTSKVDDSLCIGCGRCEEVCAYRAIKNIIFKDDRSVSHVEHDSCASCSACVSECPSGAITQGFMSDNDILNRLEDKKTPFEGVKGLISFWSTPCPLFNTYDGFVELMSARKASPSFLIRALARSGRGLIVIKPDKTTGSHYLPWEEPPEEVIQNTRDLLKMVGISPDRIKYIDFEKDKEPITILKDFSKELDEKKLGKINIPLPKKIDNPIGEAIAILRIFSSNPDTHSYDEMNEIPSAKTNDLAFFEGCIPLLYKIGKAHKYYDLGPTRNAIYKLNKKMNINAGYLHGFLCPSKGLLNLNLYNANDILSRIESKNINTLKNINPKKIILATPESYNSFSKEKKFGKISSLPSELIRIIKNNNILNPINKTIALHPACNMRQDPLYDSIKQLLIKIPEIKIVELTKKCGNNNFDHLDGNSKISAINLMHEASKKGADTIICTSPYCESHLMLCNREGSWRSEEVEISDVYQILLSSIEGEIE